MADGRHSSKLITGKLLSISTRAGRFLLVLISSLVLAYFITDDSYEEIQYYTLVLLFLSVGLWMTEAVPPFAVAILIMGYLIFMIGQLAPLEGVERTEKYVNTMSSPIIWLLLGGFFLAHGMKVTRLDLALFNASAKAFGSKPNNILLGLMLTTMFSSMIMSNTAATAMMIASVMPFITSLEKGAPITKAILLGIPSAATLGGMGTIIGSPPNAIAVALLEDQGTSVNFVKWMVYGLVPAVIAVLFFWFILTRKFISKRSSIDLKIEQNTDDFEVSPIRRRRVLIILIVTVVLWLTTPLHGWPVAAVAFLPIVFLPIFGIVTSKDFNTMPWDTLILVAGGLSLGMALDDAGIIDRFVGGLEVTGMPPFVIMLLFGWITVVLSNIMSNTATSTILIPVAITILPAFSEDIAVVVALSASCALLLPVSTPPNAMAYSTGLLDQKDFRLGGIVLGLLGPVVATAWVSFLQLLF
jgi:sodium-dependent dicarboxylate transporter 2/3/5